MWYLFCRCESKEVDIWVIQKFRQIIRIYIQCLIQNSEIMIFPCCLEQIRHTLYWQMIAKIYRLELQLEREKRGHSIGSLLHSLSMVTSAQNHWNWQNRNRCYWALIFGSLCSASINYTDEMHLLLPACNNSACNAGVRLSHVLKALQSDLVRAVFNSKELMLVIFLDLDLDSKPTVQCARKMKCTQ